MSRHELSTASRRELNSKNSTIEKLENRLQENLKEIQTRDAQAAQHETKLQEFQEQAAQGTRQIQQMEISLAECQKEIQLYVHQLEEMRKSHEQEIGDRTSQVDNSVFLLGIPTWLFPDSRGFSWQGKDFASRET